METERKPKGYWTKERCQEEALKYNTRNEYRLNSVSYCVARIKKWLDDICIHMGKKKQRGSKYNYDICLTEALKYDNRKDFKNNCNGMYKFAVKTKILNNICYHMKNKPNKPRGYWTYEKCKEISLTCETKEELYKKFGSAYGSMLENKWLNDLCVHMNDNKKSKNYWTKERCQEEALKYDNRKDFKKYSKKASLKACRNKWFNEICSHMKEIRKNNGYFSFEICKEEASKYNTKTEFMNNCPSAYSKCLSKKWIAEICSHMEEKGNLYKRCIYVYEFSDNHAYVGLTYNINKRNNEHFKRGSVYKHFIKTNDKPELIKLTDYILIDEAVLKEEYYFQEYKNSGWTMLNILKTGGTGGGKTKKYTNEICHLEALKYGKRIDFRKNSSKIYNVSKKRKIMDIICSHMEKQKSKPAGYWTFENCEIEAQKYNTKMDFKSNSGGCYQQSIKNNWLGKICSHMIKRKSE